MEGQEWSWEENKTFEMALAVVDEEDPNRWKVVAVMLGGEKSAEDVKRHYVILLEDLQCIESGELDHTLSLVNGGIGVDEHTPYFTDEDHQLLTNLDLN